MSLCPTLVTGVNSLRESPAPGLSEWNIPEETPEVCVPILLSSVPLAPGQISIAATPHFGVCCYSWGRGVCGDVCVC